MLRNFSVGLITIIALLMLAACGGGGGEAPGTTITGVASKGIIKNGTVRVYALNADGSKGALLKETVTDGNGAYRADIGKYRGAVLVEANGSYTDEATGALKEVTADAPLRAAIGDVYDGVAIAVTPLTELAVQKNEDPLSHRINVATIETSNTLISDIFRVGITRTMPVDAMAANSGDTQEQKEYALVLAAIAKLMQSKGSDLHTVLTELKEAIGTDNRLATPAAAELQAALTDFANSINNKTGISDISTTTLINIGGSIKTLTVATAGTTALIGGIDAVVTLPPGVTVKADASGKVLDSVLSASGMALGSSVAGHYTPPTAGRRGNVRIGIISAGFGAGEFATIQCDIAPGAAPAAADFIISELKAFDSQLNFIDLGIALALGP